MRLPAWLADLDPTPDPEADNLTARRICTESNARSLARWRRVLDGNQSTLSACDEEDNDP